MGSRIDRNSDVNYYIKKFDKNIFHSQSDIRIIRSTTLIEYVYSSIYCPKTNVSEIVTHVENLY